MQCQAPPRRAARLLLRVPWWLGTVPLLARASAVDYDALDDRTVEAAALFREDQWPLSTWERYIVDRRNDRVKWACVNWAGAYFAEHVVLGLNRRPIDDIARRIRVLGFNCVRLPFSTQGVIENPLVADKEVMSANPQLRGGRMLDLFDAAVKALTDQRLMVIINNHNSKSGWCCSTDSEEGLWYTPEYNESQWIRGLVTLAERYKGNKHVVAFDVRNEPHDYGGVGLTWGDGNPKTDYAGAVARAGHAILAESPHVLIVVEALCLAKDLRPLRNSRVPLPRKRVVYEVHAYHYFQIYSMWSDMFMSWLETRRIALAIAFIPILCLAFLYKAYNAVLVCRPPGVLFTSIGIWVFFVCLAFVLFHVLVWFAMNSTSCAIAATEEQLPLILFWCTPMSGGLILFLMGYEYHMGARCARRWFFDVTDCDADDDADARELRRASDNAEQFETAELTDFTAMKDDADTEDSEEDIAMCGSSNVDSIRSAWKGLRTGIPQQTTWDKGMCCGLQCGICSALLFIGMVSFYIFCRVVVSYWWFQRHHDSMWGFALIQGKKWTAPIWVGEFGTSSARGDYWLNLMQYMSERDVDWAYWQLNPEKPLTQEYVLGKGWVHYTEGKWVNETWGILESDWDSVRHPWKMLDLRRVMTSPAHWSPEGYPCDRSIYGSECGG